MTVSLPYLWPRLTTCLTIRNVSVKTGILAEPRRLEEHRHARRHKGWNSHYDASWAEILRYPGERSLPACVRSAVGAAAFRDPARAWSSNWPAGVRRWQARKSAPAS